MIGDQPSGSGRISVPDGGFPGGTAVSRVRVYDWLAADGVAGGSPHLHTASTEGYLVLRGHGSVETLSSAGYREHPLTPGTVLWFTPGTVHRLVNGSGDLEILVVMGNAGLPEAGDAVFTFPPELLADPRAYARAACLPATTDRQRLSGAVRRRRDLAVAGYLTLREQLSVGDQSALARLHAAAAALVREPAWRWRELWRRRPLAQAIRTGRQLDALATGHYGHLAEASVHQAAEPAPRYGMCGHLYAWRTTSD